jgi:sarcosine oxidase
MPVFIAQEPDGRLFYGIPDVGRGVKVARHHGGEPISPDEVKREVTKSDKRPVVELVRRSLPKLNAEPSSWTNCIYTNTPDGDFIIDFHPLDKRVLVVSACSGHGFKFASVIGEIGADLITKGMTRHDISRFSIGRFAAQSD